MKIIKRYLMILCFSILLFIIPQTLLALEILILDRDNNSYINDPEGAGNVGCQYAIQQALLANDESYTTLSYLPTDLSNYDIIFVTLGHWCLD